jgi:hypothetical protein
VHLIDIQQQGCCQMHTIRRLFAFGVMAHQLAARRSNAPINNRRLNPRLAEHCFYLPILHLIEGLRRSLKPHLKHLSERPKRREYDSVATSGFLPDGTATRMLRFVGVY